MAPLNMGNKYLLLLKFEINVVLPVHSCENSCAELKINKNVTVYFLTCFAVLNMLAKGYEEKMVLKAPQIGDYF